MASSRGSAKFLPEFFVRWIMTAVAVWIATRLVPEVEVTGSVWRYIVVAIVFGFLNTTLGSLLRFLTLPVVILTVGLFRFVISGVVLGVTAWLLPFFTVSGVVAALLGALVIVVFSELLYYLVGKPLSK